MNTQVQPATVKPVPAPAWRAWIVPVLYVLGWFVLYDQLEPATDSFMRWLLRLWRDDGFDKAFSSRRRQRRA